METEFDNEIEKDGINIEETVEDIAESLGFQSEDKDEKVDNTPEELTKPTAVKEPVVEGEPSEEGKQAAKSPAQTSAPKTWRPEAMKHWETLPVEVQSEITKREEDMFRGIESYKETAKIGKAFTDVLSPYMETYEKHQVDPMKQVQSLLHAHHILTFATEEQKVAVFNKLAETYNVPLGAPLEAPYVDPTVAGLKKTIDNLQNRLDNNENTIVTEQKEKIRMEIDTFASDPANAYFDEVASDIALLLKAKAATNLKDAYEKAVWANPITRAKEQSRLAAEKDAEAKKLEMEKVQAAKKAASVNVRTSTKQGRGTAPVGSIDDTLNETFAKIQARS